MGNSSDEVAFLVALKGPLNGQRWAIQTNLNIGREMDCDIVVHDRQVSRHHARICNDSKGLTIYDLSKNGTFVNGTQIEEKTLLHDGDILQIALAQKFIFLSSDSTLPLDSINLDWETVANLALPDENEIGKLRLDKRSRRVWIYTISEESIGVEEEILPPLSVSQFRLLDALYQNQGKVVSRIDLVTAVWGENQSYEISEQALDALVRRLRERINRIDPQHNYIVTIRGHGLRLDNPARLI